MHTKPRIEAYIAHLEETVQLLADSDKYREVYLSKKFGVCRSMLGARITAIETTVSELNVPWTDFAHLQQYTHKEQIAGLREYLAVWESMQTQAAPSAPSVNVLADGTQEWRVDGKLHREGDLPAVIGADGTRHWWVDGNRHRAGDQPAVIYADGTQWWYVDGKLHRAGDLPAVIRADGTQEWWVDGSRHRAGDLPAVIRADGTQGWWVDGSRHRAGDQPAIIRADGVQEWWVDDKRIK